MIKIGHVSVVFDPDLRVWTLRSHDTLPVLYNYMERTLKEMGYSYGQDGHLGTYAMIIPKDEDNVLTEFEMIKGLLESR
jgi:hypothetical protein